jgi:ATP-dependent DNA ligase
MSHEFSERKTKDVLETSAAYAVRAQRLSHDTLSRCSRSAEQRALTQEQLFKTICGIQESKERLRRASACLETDAVSTALSSRASVPANVVTTRTAPSQAQLAAYVLEPPSGPEWIHELKQEGHRLLCRRDGKRIAIVDSDGRDWSASFPGIAEALLALKVDSIKMDGDVVSLDDDGFSCRLRLDDSLVRGIDSGLIFFAFDLLHLNGKDMGHLPLHERKNHLRRVLRTEAKGKIRYAAHLRQNGKRMLEQAYLLGLEGIVSKRCDAPYRAGIGLDWQMTKCARHHLTRV